MERKPAPVAPMIVEEVEEVEAVVNPDLVEDVAKQPSQSEPALLMPVQSAEMAMESVMPDEEPMPDPSTLDLALPPKPPAPTSLE
jgi:hypothetical protein